HVPHAPPLPFPTRRSSDLERSHVGPIDLHHVVLDLAASQHVNLAAGSLIECARGDAWRHFEELREVFAGAERQRALQFAADVDGDRKSTRLNSSHVAISYA